MVWVAEMLLPCDNLVYGMISDPFPALWFGKGSDYIGLGMYMKIKRERERKNNSRYFNFFLELTFHIYRGKENWLCG